MAEVNWQVFRWVNEAGHPIIVTAYFILAVIVTFIRLPTIRETTVARLGGAAFFSGCALHHIDMWVHGLEGSPLLFGSFHHTLATVLQVFGASAFILAAGPYAREWVVLARNPALLRTIRDRARDA